MIIALGTIVSSLMSDRFTKRLGTGKITACSVLVTAVALFGFSISHSFIALCLWAIPYGLGAGSVDASLNNFVALHYASRHMSWLHCMWSIGASLGPYIMGYALTGGHNWNMGLSLHCFPAVRTDCDSAAQPADVENRAGAGSCHPRRPQFRQGAFPAGDHPHPGGEGDHDHVLLLLRGGTDCNPLGEQLSCTVPQLVRRSGGRICKPVLCRHHGRPGAWRIFDVSAERYPDDPVRTGYYPSGYSVFIFCRLEPAARCPDWC